MFSFFFDLAINFVYIFKETMVLQNRIYKLFFVPKMNIRSCDPVTQFAHSRKIARIKFQTS